MWARKGEYVTAITDFTEAIKLDPKSNAYSYNAFAWIAATCSDERYRDGNVAVTNATKACELTAWKTWSYVATLAAAYAESSDFANAIKWQEKAIELATKEQDKQSGQERLELYFAGKPYRESPKR